jgi:hypothetical protein
MLFVAMQTRRRQYLRSTFHSRFRSHSAYTLVANTQQLAQKKKKKKKKQGQQRNIAMKIVSDDASHRDPHSPIAPVTQIINATNAFILAAVRPSGDQLRQRRDHQSPRQRSCFTAPSGNAIFRLFARSPCAPRARCFPLPVNRREARPKRPIAHWPIDDFNPKLKFQVLI